MGNIKGAKRGSYKKKNNSPVYSKPDIIEKVKSNLDKLEEEEPFKDWKEVKEEVEQIKSDLVLEEAISETEKEVYKDIHVVEKTGEDSMEDFFKSFEKVEPSSNPINETVEEKVKERKPRKSKEDSEQVIRDSNAMLINGGMLIAMCDFFFPGILKFIFSKFLKNKYASKVQHKDVALNPDQVKSIEKVSDHAAMVIFEKVNPMILFFIGMMAMYGMNFKMALDNIENKSK